MNTSRTDSAETKPAVPYIAFATLRHLIERLAEEGLPPRIDRSYLKGSEGGKTQVLQALRSLELIDQHGTVTDDLTRLVNDDENRPQLVADRLASRYPGLLELGKVNATQSQLEDELRKGGVSGDTLRKAAAFYLKAAEYAGVTVSPNWKTPSVGANTKRRPTLRRDQQRNPEAPPSDANTEPQRHRVEKPTYPGLHPALAGVLYDLPREGESWTATEKERFMAAFTAMIDYSIPVTDAMEDEPEE
jgi:hypothetical protein